MQVRAVFIMIACMALGSQGDPMRAIAGEAPRPDVDGRKVIFIEPIKNVHIEMPDRSIHDFGMDLQERLRTLLTESGKYIVWDSISKDSGWTGTSVPAATVRVKVDTMSFSTGSRGERMFYGFDERVSTPFNTGEPLAEEFPLRAASFEPNWFDRSFDSRGVAPFDSRSGLDLGDGFQIDAVFASLSVKYARYRSRLDLTLEIDAPLAGKKEFRPVQVSGKGWFYDVAGAYEGYSGGIMVARKDAMERGIKNAIEGSWQALDRGLQNLPLTARIDAVLSEHASPGSTGTGRLLLGTGLDARVKAGIRYELVADSSTIVEVVESTVDGSVAKFVSGKREDLVPGKLLRQAGFGAAPSGLRAELDFIELPKENFPKPKFQDGQIPKISDWRQFLSGAADSLTLPYRIWRYFMYDQSYHKEVAEDEDEAGQDLSRLSRKSRKDAWAKQIGLDPAEAGGTGEPVVAVIDSGVDYNHPAIHDQLWLNPFPLLDPAGRKDLYGWDFVSGDGRPFDDGYHGTELASAVLLVAPNARIMPLKVFNAWGITRSALILSAFRYAADHGAKIILCGWATRRFSQAIEMGVEYARAHGVLVVAAAGDRGDLLSQVAAWPAAFSKKHENVIAVTGVDENDELVRVKGKFANRDPELIQLAAPGKSILVAEPRSGTHRETSTSVAAALVAGAAARIQGGGSLDYHALKATLLNFAEEIPGLKSGVQRGRRLRIQ